MAYLFLSKPSGVYKKQYLEMLTEWTATGEELIPWVLKLNCSNFEQLVKNLNDLSMGFNLQNGQVQATTLWLMRSDGKMIGCVNIRHSLNRLLADYGGHIGYGIRPFERRKGYGCEILRLSLIEARKLGIGRVRITCDDDNVASERIILKNGGTFDSKGVENGKIIKRFWINEVFKNFSIKGTSLIQ